MAQPTIKNIWAQNTSNKLEFTEEEVANGIVEKSEVVSNQLNGVFNRSETFIDLLQRANAWNAGKTYNTGDMCFVAVNFRKSCDTSGKRYVMIFISNVDNNTAEPLIRKSATTFTLNNDLVVPLYTITQNNDTTALSSYTNSTYWTASDLTMGDLTNATQLKVCDDATIKGNATIDGSLTVGGTNKTTIDTNGNITTGTLITNSIEGVQTSISDTIATPSYGLTSSASNIVNADWFYNKSRGRLSSIINEYEVVSLFNNTTKWTECDYIYACYDKGYSYSIKRGGFEAKVCCGRLLSVLKLKLIALRGGGPICCFFVELNADLQNYSYYITMYINSINSINEYSNPFYSTGGATSSSFVGFRKK